MSQPLCLLYADLSLYSYRLYTHTFEVTDKSSDDIRPLSYLNGCPLPNRSEKFFYYHLEIPLTFVKTVFYVRSDVTFYYDMVPDKGRVHISVIPVILLGSCAHIYLTKLDSIYIIISAAVCYTCVCACVERLLCIFVYELTM